MGAGLGATSVVSSAGPSHCGSALGLPGAASYLRRPTVPCERPGPASSGPSPSAGGSSGGSFTAAVTPRSRSISSEIEIRHGLLGAAAAAAAASPHGSNDNLDKLADYSPTHFGHRFNSIH